MIKARAAALSSAGLMLIAGCSGGGHGGGSSLPMPLGTSSAIALANAARVTLSINIPPRQTQSFRRGQKFVPAAATRKPSYVSPSTYYVSLNAVSSGGTSIYSTYFTVAQCTPYGSVYECATNLPSGTFTLYTNLYDQQGYMLSTNMYSHPSAVTVYPNGSAYSNYLYVQTAGVINNLQTLAPSGCFAAGHQQSIPLYVLDADGNTIVGPVANPITPTFTAVNGAGLAAINIYAIYNGSPISINNVAVSDTSLYSSPYFFVNGSEGAVNIAATFQNMPVYSNGAFTYTPSAGYAATGTYVAWAIDASAYNIYTIAVEQSINQAITCGGGVNGTYQQWTYIGSIKDSSNGNPYIVASDFNNNVDVFDGYVTADYTRSYMFFQTSVYGNPGPHAALYQTMDYVTTNPFVDFFTSANVTGRINVLSSNGSTGQIALIDTANGAQSALHGPFTTAFPLYGTTRVTGTQLYNALYYDVVNTTWLYGVNTSTSTAFTPIDFSTSTAITGQIYSMSPSGNAHSYQFVRGADTSGNFHICAFDANPANFGLGIYCANTSSHNANVASMQFDPGSGALMWSGGFSGSTSTVYALNAYAQPSTFAAGPFAGAPHYTLSSATFRFVPGLEAVPGVVGLYGGPQTSGPCTGTGEVTWLSYSGGVFTYIASVCWPTHYITLTYQ